MKNLPYTSCFVVLQINNSIRKLYFEVVINYANYSDPNFYEHKKCMVEMAFGDNEYAEKLFMLLSQSYLNAKSVIKEFKTIAKDECEKSSNLCVTLIVDIHDKDDGGATIEIETRANDEKRDAFNYLAQYISRDNMCEHIRKLTAEQQDLLFNIA